MTPIAPFTIFRVRLPRRWLSQGYSLATDCRF